MCHRADNHPVTAGGRWHFLDMPYAQGSSPRIDHEELHDLRLGVTTRRRDAFARYVLPEMEVLYRASLSLTAQPADAEDLVQDTVLRAYRAIESFDGRHPRAWLLTIMRRAELNRHRRRRPDLVDRDTTETWERLACPRGGEDSPEHLVVEETFDAVIGAAFSALPRPYQRAVELVDIQDLTYTEAARLLGITEGTLASRLHRARAQIRARLTAAGVA